MNGTRLAFTSTPLDGRPSKQEYGHDPVSVRKTDHYHLFFVTSSDSGSYVVDTLTSGGHANPPIWQRIFWALTEGAVAIVLLLVGGLEALQSAAITTGLPFCIVMLLMCWSLHRALVSEKPATSAAPAAS